ncbi:nonsense-mediated mRNA decay protein 2-like [Cynara cardunculus var. scolymus]|uniref:nonsense-mediated mRNA decay protein 2-like n=1 Tax=Cynara cardunculus var. scolymus TaxID=59895 RepID=UPI000D62E5BB|nr:nonsense-mediated mRNA decay protein 2-like [Cynara cardunculus var. scolymus]
MNTSITTTDHLHSISTIISFPPSLVSITLVDDPMVVVPTNDEAITIGLEVAPLEAPQTLAADPQEGACELTSVNPSNDVEDPSGPSGNEPTTIETEVEVYDMVEDVKLLLYMDEVHNEIPLKKELNNGLSAVKSKVHDVKESLMAVKTEVQANVDVVVVLSNKADDVQAYSFSLEHKLENHSSHLNDLTSRLDNDKEGEKDKEEEKLVAAEETADDDDALIPHVDAPIPNAKDAFNTKDDDDVVIAPADHEDYPFTSVLPNVGDEDDDEDTEPQLSDVGDDLGDDDEDDNDDNDFYI